MLLKTQLNMHTNDTCPFKGGTLQFQFFKKKFVMHAFIFFKCLYECELTSDNLI